MNSYKPLNKNNNNNTQYKKGPNNMSIYFTEMGTQIIDK